MSTSDPVALPDRPKRAIVILGVHRSGTSALAAALGALGWTLPRDALRPQPDNPLGFHESTAVVDLNDRVLAECGTSWSSSRFFPASGQVCAEPDMLAPFIERAREAIRNAFGQSDAICLKDPRTLLLSPLWHAALCLEGYEPEYLLIVRHPLEVAESLMARDSTFDRAHGLRLWIRYTLALVGLPVDARVGQVLQHAELLSDPRSCLSPKFRRVGYGDAGDPASVVKPELRHHAAEFVPHDALPSLINGLYEALFKGPLTTFEERKSLLAPFEKSYREFLSLAGTQSDSVSNANPVSPSGADRRVELVVPTPGSVVQVGEARGLFADGWVGAELRVHLPCQRRVSRIVVKGYIPVRAPPGSRRFRVEIVDNRYDFVVAKLGEFTLECGVDLPAGSMSELVVRCAPTFTGAEVGVAEDVRTLGFVLKRVEAW